MKAMIAIPFDLPEDQEDAVLLQRMDEISATLGQDVKYVEGPVMAFIDIDGMKVATEAIERLRNQIKADEPYDQATTEKPQEAP